MCTTTPLDISLVHSKSSVLSPHEKVGLWYTIIFCLSPTTATLTCVS